MAGDNGKSKGYLGGHSPGKHTLPKHRYSKNGPIGLPDQKLVLPHPKKIVQPGTTKIGLNSEEIRYGGGIISLSKDGTKLFWQRDEDNPKVCMELLLGCICLVKKVLEKAVEESPYTNPEISGEIVNDMIHKIKLVLGEIPIKADTDPGLPDGELCKEKEAN